ncbi:MAG: hypothetical protein K5893_04500, partial [Prevotella sp.]|nr:hypothetical protein [Prevotella sp.]
MKRTNRILSVPDLSKIAITEIVDADVTVSYHDNDIIMIDNVKLLAEPNPARLQMNLVAFCNRGKVQAMMNGAPVLFSANQLMICPSQVSISDFMFSPDFAFRAIFVSNSMLQSFLHDKINVWTDLLYVRRTNVIQLDDEHIWFLNHFYEMLDRGNKMFKDIPYQSEIVQSLLRAAFLGFCSMFESQMFDIPPESRTGIGAPMFQKFLNLLHSTPVKHQSVEWYADKLCISPKYLSSICKDNSGKTAYEWIREHVLEDIRYYLKSTDL